MWKMPQQIERRKVEPYRYFNYALLHITGVSEVFNFMRYNSAFLAREHDFQMLLEASNAEQYNEWMVRKLAILLCRYDWAGKTKANWEHRMLLSEQQLQEVSDVATLYELSADNVELRAPSKPTLKFEHILAIDGTLQYVLEVMYRNKAFPHSEKDARLIEQAFYPYSKEEPIQVQLRNYLGVETEWVLPDDLD